MFQLNQVLIALKVLSIFLPAEKEKKIPLMLLFTSGILSRALLFNLLFNKPNGRKESNGKHPCK